MARVPEKLPTLVWGGKVRFNLDSLGVCASTLCMIHCLVFPLLLAVLPAWTLTSGANASDIGKPSAAADSSVEGGLESAECVGQECCEAAGGNEVANGSSVGCCSTPTDFWIHVGLLSTVAPLGLVAWGAGYRKHHGRGVVLLGMVGVILLCCALWFGTRLFGGRGEQVMTVLGSICMVSAHLWNRHRCRCCRTCDITGIVESEPVVSPAKFA